MKQTKQENTKMEQPQLVTTKTDQMELETTRVKQRATMEPQAWEPRKFRYGLLGLGRECRESRYSLCSFNRAYMDHRNSSEIISISTQRICRQTLLP